MRDSWACALIAGVWVIASATVESDWVALVCACTAAIWGISCILYSVQEARSRQ